MSIVSPAEDLTRSEWRRLKRLALHENVTQNALASGVLRKYIVRREKELNIRGNLA